MARRLPWLDNGLMIVSSIDRHSVKRVKSATEVSYDISPEASEFQQSA